MKYLFLYCRWGVVVPIIEPPVSMKKYPLFCLATLAALVTGCPHNEYVVELTPHSNVIERKLVFYREDGTDTNGVPNYQSFPSNELAAITGLYPPGGTTH